MMRWILVLMLMLVVGTAAAAHPVDGGWHRSDEPADTNTTTPPITSRTVTHYHPMSELSEVERTLLVTPTPPPVAMEIKPADATFVWGVVAVAILIGVVLLLRHRGRKNGE